MMTDQLFEERQALGSDRDAKGFKIQGVKLWVKLCCVGMVLSQTALLVGAVETRAMLERYCPGADPAKKDSFNKFMLKGGTFSSIGLGIINGMFRNNYFYEKVGAFDETSSLMEVVRVAFNTAWGKCFLALTIISILVNLTIFVPNLFSRRCRGFSSRVFSRRMFLDRERLPLGSEDMRKTVNKVFAFSLGFVLALAFLTILSIYNGVALKRSIDYAFCQLARFQYDKEFGVTYTQKAEDSSWLSGLGDGQVMAGSRSIDEKAPLKSFDAEFLKELDEFNKVMGKVETGQSSLDTLLYPSVNPIVEPLNKHIPVKLQFLPMETVGYLDIANFSKVIPRLRAYVNTASTLLEFYKMMEGFTKTVMAYVKTLRKSDHLLPLGHKLYETEVKSHYAGFLTISISPLMVLIWVIAAMVACKVLLWRGVEPNPKWFMISMGCLWGTLLLMFGLLFLAGTIHFVILGMSNSFCVTTRSFARDPSLMNKYSIGKTLYQGEAKEIVDSCFSNKGSGHLLPETLEESPASLFNKLFLPVSSFSSWLEEIKPQFVKADEFTQKYKNNFLLMNTGAYLDKDPPFYPLYMFETVQLSCAGEGGVAEKDWTRLMFLNDQNMKNEYLNYFKTHKLDLSLCAAGASASLDDNYRNLSQWLPKMRNLALTNKTSSLISKMCSILEPKPSCTSNPYKPLETDQDIYISNIIVKKLKHSFNDKEECEVDMSYPPSDIISKALQHHTWSDDVALPNGDFCVCNRHVKLGGQIALINAWTRVCQNRDSLPNYSEHSKKVLDIFASFAVQPKILSRISIMTPSEANVVDQSYCKSMTYSMGSTLDGFCDAVQGNMLGAAFAWFLISILFLGFLPLTFNIYHYFHNLAFYDGDLPGPGSRRPSDKVMHKSTSLFLQAVAAEDDSADLLQQLDDKSLSDVQDNLRNNSLHFAVYGGDISKVNLLLEREASLNASNDFGFTPLGVAVSEGNVGLSNMLIQKGANPIVSDAFGDTPLHTAVRSGNLQMVKVLCQDCAPEPVYPNAEGELPVHLAESQGRTSIREVLASRTRTTALQPPQPAGNEEPLGHEEEWPCESSPEEP